LVISRKVPELPHAVEVVLQSPRPGDPPVLETEEIVEPAAHVQLLVLIGLLAAEALAVVATAELVARGRIHRPPAVR
jgi:hypothetical protein